MSPSHSPITPALQQHHIFNLILILRRANQHYRHIAGCLRMSIHPTYHARKRAEQLGLSVDIHKAINCAQRQISVVPLPILDTTSSPTVEVAVQRRPVLRCDIPTIKIRGPHSTVPSSLSSPSAAPAPSVLCGKNVPWCGPSSRFSMTPVDVRPAICLPTLPVDVECQEMYDHYHQESDQDDYDGGDVPMEGEQYHHRRRSSLPVLDVPIDEEEIDWGMCDVDSVADGLSLSEASFSSDSSDSTTSSGPRTPDAPIMIRIKRKSNHLIASTPAFEKRRKHESSVSEEPEWVPANRRDAIYIAPRW